MVTITKTQIIEAVSTAISEAVENTGELSDEERQICYNAMLSEVKSLDPYKGTPTIKF